MDLDVVPVSLPALRWGDPGAAVRVLLVHGLTSSGATWWQVADALARAGCRVTAVDLRGHGSAPATAAYRIPEMAADLSLIADPARAAAPAAFRASVPSDASAGSRGAHGSAVVVGSFGVPGASVVAGSSEAPAASDAFGTSVVVGSSAAGSAVVPALADPAGVIRPDAGGTVKGADGPGREADGGDRREAAGGSQDVDGREDIGDSQDVDGRVGDSGGRAAEGADWDVVVGHSLGGAVVVSAAAAGWIKARAYVLIDPVLSVASEPAGQYVTAITAELAATPEEIARAQPRWHPETIRLKVAAAAACSPYVVEQTLLGNLPWELIHLIAGIDAPLTILGADPAADGPSFTAEHAAALPPNATYRMAEGCGHSIHRDDPAYVVAAIKGAIDEVIDEAAAL